MRAGKGREKGVECWGVKQILITCKFDSLKVEETRTMGVAYYYDGIQ